MKKIILLFFVLLCFSSCYVRMKNKTVNYEMEVRALSPYETGACQYWLKGVNKSKLKGKLIIVDTVGRYNLGDRFILSPK